MRFCPRCGDRFEHEAYCPEDGVPTEALASDEERVDALLGAVVDGRYRVEAQIGEGGMGVVYRATHVALNKQLALKVLRGEMARDADVVQRFVQEAQAATAIGHENIIDISDFGRLADGTVYFVMEYLSGQPLTDMIDRGGSIPVADAIHIIKQIAAALGAAHERGIVHRDLKPDNVYIASRADLPNFVKVLDFGIAKVGGASNKLTRTGMVFGTPHYMSPEQAAGQSVDRRTDIYALGVIMYEMFTGHVPFDGDTFMGVLTKHMFEPPPPMSDPDGRQLGALEAITLRALEKKPENRYQTMAELVADLELYAGGAVPASRVTGKEPSVALADALEPRSRSEMRLEQHSSMSPSRRRAKALYAAAGALAVMAVALSGWLVLRDRDGDEAAAAKVVAEVPKPGAQQVTSKPPQEPLPAPQGQVEARLASQEIYVASDPVGAKLVMDGAIIGQTPARLPRPEGADRRVELVLEGYESELVLLSGVSPERLLVSLRKKAPSRPFVRHVEPAPPTPPPPEPRSPPPSSRRYRRSMSEVIDPWANN